MSKKPKNKKPFRENILLNIVAIIATGTGLLLLVLLLLNVYTRHGHNVIVPELHGLQVEEAEALLKSRKLSIQIIDSIYKKDAVPGSIIEQSPKPKNKVKEGRDIYLTIYAYQPQQVSVPELVDYSTRQAMALLNSIGFSNVSIQEVPAQYHGLVMAVEYQGRRLMADEEIPAGAPVKLIVGSNALEDDSLNENGESIIVPADERPDHINKSNQGGSKEKSNIDESFF